MNEVVVIGAGLAGCEAAWQMAERGIPVRLYEMKPKKMTPAHHAPDFAELCCSNSLRAEGLANAVGLLKEEMRRLDSLILQCADATRVEAGGALAVDRFGFSGLVTEKIRSHRNITIVEEEVTEIPAGPVIVASGPLTSDALADAIHRYFGSEYLHFYDAAAPLVSAESVDFEKAWYASRYDRGTADYINCGMDKDEYEAFITALTTAEQAEVHGFEDARVFEGCMPIEVMARRGLDTARFGPLKPVGLKDPKTGREPWALHDAEFVRYGVMHRNTFLDSPRLLDSSYAARKDPTVAFAGQMTGVEGYVESAASGLVAGVCMAYRVLEKPVPVFPQRTAIGALAAYISDPSVGAFQPMNVNFGIITPLGYKVKGKRNKNEAISARALQALEQIREAGL